MPTVIVAGGVALRGVAEVQGSKNVALHLLAAAILNHDTTTIDNVPRLPDMDAVAAILNHAGITVVRDGSRVVIDGRHIDQAPRMPAVARSIRPTMCFAAALLARTGTCDATLPGGDRFCARGTDVHTRAFRAAGATIERSAGRLRLCAPRSGLRPFRVDAMTPYGPSLGGTVTALLLAASIPATSIVRSPNLEPEVTQTVAMLRHLGVQVEDVEGAMRVTGRALIARPVHVHNPADRMVAGTLVLYAALTGGTLQLPRPVADLLTAGFLRVLPALGIGQLPTDDTVRFGASGPLRPVHVRTAVHPGFPTDLQPQVCAATAKASGTSRLVETVYPRRATHAHPLRQFGISITAHDGPPATLTIDGPHSRLRPAAVTATDIRAAAALLGAALAAPGESVIAGAEHLARGYENLPELINRLGGSMTWTNDRADTPSSA